MPIGKGEKSDVFKSYEFPIIKGNMIYLITDGFADQFGGPKAKKFMHKKLKELLFINVSESTSVQKEKLSEAFNNWKGNHEQVDDVTILGIRL